MEQDALADKGGEIQPELVPGRRDARVKVVVHRRGVVAAGSSYSLGLTAVPGSVAGFSNVGLGCETCDDIGIGFVGNAV